MMKYYFVNPVSEFSMMGTNVELNRRSTYLAIEATNQPDPEDKFFVIYSGDGEWQVDVDDIEHCLGFLLERDELIFLGEGSEMTDEEAIDRLNGLNAMVDPIDVAMELFRGMTDEERAELLNFDPGKLRHLLR